MLRVAKKIKKNRTRDRTTMRLLFLTLYVEVSLVPLVTLDATARADVGADVGCHTSLGIFFRLQVVEFDIRFLFLSLMFVIYLLWGCLLIVLCQWHRTAIVARL